MPIKEALGHFLERLSEMRLQVSRLKEAQQPEEARAQIELALKRFTGSNLQLIHALPTEQLVALLASGGRINAEKGLFIAEMLILEAELTPGPAKEEVSLKALTLYLEAFGEEDELIHAYGQRVAEVMDGLKRVAMPTGLKHRVFEHYAASGGYARAENLLFELVGDEPDAALLERGRQFYLELLGRSDSALEAGGLPRDEVAESLAELERLGV